MELETTDDQTKYSWMSKLNELDDTDELVKTSGYGGVQYSSVRIAE